MTHASVLTSAGRAGVMQVALDPDGTGKRKAIMFPVGHFLDCLGRAHA
jgi:hypothetical protein